MACTLTATEQPQRLAEMRAVGRSALLGASTDHRRAVLRFRSTARARERLAAIVAAEGRCCAFLDMTLDDEGDIVVLTIGAPPGGEPILAELVAAFGGGAGPT